MFQHELESDTGIKPQSRRYRLWFLQKIQRSWPGLWELRLDQITEQACKDWAAKLNKEIASHYFNNTTGTLKMVIETGIKAHKDKCGERLENPAAELRRVRVKQKELHLPEPSHFKTLVENLRVRSGGWGPRVADLVEFLAYGGMRIYSETVWVAWDDIDWQRKEIIVRGNPDTGTKNSEIRRLPILPDMEALLLRLKDKLGGIEKGKGAWPPSRSSCCVFNPRWPNPAMLTEWATNPDKPLDTEIQAILQDARGAMAALADNFFPEKISPPASAHSSTQQKSSARSDTQRM